MDADKITTMSRLNDDQFTKDLMLLESDIEVEGWDQPARLYAILGEPGDYRLELITRIPYGHPVDFCRSAVCGDPNTGWPGGRLPDSVKGVALATEAWRHPSADDLAEIDPAMWATIQDAAVQFGLTDKAQITQHINNAMRKAFAHVPPSANPSRIELRTIQVIMRDGRGVGILRDRDKEPHIADTGLEARMPKALNALLTGCWPNDPDLAPDEEEE